MSMADTISRIEQSFRTRLEPIGRQARAAWMQRTPRERSLLRSAALVLGVALLWLVGIQPGLERVRSAHAQLPVLQSQASRLDAIILEAKALDRGRSGTLSLDETEQALRGSLSSSGLVDLSRFSASADAQAQWQIEFANAPAGRLVEWMSGLPYVAQVRTVQVSLARSNINGRDRPGLLTGTVILAMPDAEAP